MRILYLAGNSLCYIFCASAAQCMHAHMHAVHAVQLRRPSRHVIQGKRARRGPRLSRSIDHIEWAMGNTTSNKAPDAASGAYSPTPREETVYGEYFHPPPGSTRYSSSGTYGPSSLGTTSSSVTPPVPPRATGLERRSMTVVARERPSDSPVRLARRVVNLLMRCVNV